MDFKDIYRIFSDIKKMDDEDIELFVGLTKEKGLTFDADYLRFILKDIRNSN